MKSHKDLIVWQKSMLLVKRLYEVTSSYPKDEIFGITSQMRRAAVSIPSNIAEGYGRLYEKDTVRFLSTALGSASELETQMLISKQLMLASDQELDDLLMLNNEIIRMLVALSKKLSNQ
ncbi:MAG: four helix bundle protein [Prevotella sp.]|nr:four helix bundle protein [Prevotella sp.]